MQASRFVRLSIVLATARRRDAQVWTYQAEAFQESDFPDLAPR